MDVYNATAWGEEIARLIAFENGDTLPSHSALKAPRVPEVSLEGLEDTGAYNAFCARLAGSQADDTPTRAW